MRVELGKALSILAHEVRGPVGVLQGYLRMLRDGVADPAIVARMLQAMQDATSRLTVIARDASALSAWCEGRRADGSEVVPLRTLLEQVAAHGSGPTPPVVRLGDQDGAQVRSSPAGMLVVALAAVLQAVSRELPQAPLALTARGNDSHLAVTIGRADDDHREDEGGDPTPFPFDGGGTGLALVLASYVLESHGATVEAVANAPFRATVRLLRERGLP
jgi:two-component system, OmpR family, sensor histidine kinase BaeS